MAESSPVECSSRSCKGGCSLESCTQICGASDVCDHFTMCSEYQCHDLACWDDCSSVTDYCQSATGTVGDLQRTSSHSESLDPIQCPWILPGEPCDVTVETKQALGKHINQEHIDPQSTLKCPWGQCTKVLDRRSISNHFLQQHQPEQLENWSDFVVTGLEELDCRFGGCEVTLRDPSQLKNHVNEDHLNLMGFHDWSSNNEILQNSNNPSDLCQRLPQGKTTQTYNDLQYMSTPHGSRSWNSLPEISPPKCSQSNGPLQNQMGSTPFGRSTANYQTQQYGLSSLWQKQADAYSIFSRSHDHPAITQGRSYQCVFGDTTMSNDQAHDSDRLSCLWIVDLKGLSTCDKCFPTAKQLQEHVENEHIHLKKSYPQSQAKASAKCHWKGCLRSEEKGPLSDMNKLSRHVLTHTNRMSPTLQTHFLRFGINTDT